MEFMRKSYILVWLDKTLSDVHTKTGEYNELKEFANTLSNNDNVITIDLYEKTESIKNNLVDFLLEKNK